MTPGELGALIKRSGYKDAAVHAAVKAFQAAAHLPADGVYGPKTRAALVGAGAIDAPEAYFQPTSPAAGAAATAPQATAAAPAGAAAPAAAATTPGAAAAAPAGAAPGASPAATSAPAAAGSHASVHELAALIQKSGYKDASVQAAVKAFQAATGLHADGLYGPQTRAALVGAGAAEAPPAYYEPHGTAPSAATAASPSPSTGAGAPSSAPSASAGAGLAMHPSVQKAFEGFSTKFEGFLPYMYLDIKGLVTTGMGNLIDPIGAALGLPWKRPDGSLASQDEIRAAWNAVKARTDLAPKYGQAFAGVTTLRLDKDGIEQLIARKLKENEDYLRKKYPGYEKWPADAQLGLHSMAWAMGPGFKFPAFDAAVNREPPDFHAAAAASHINDAGNPGLTPRNKANFDLFTNAARVLETGADPSALYWPGDVLAAVKAAAGQAAGAVQTAAAGALSTVRRHHLGPILIAGGLATLAGLLAVWIRHNRAAQEVALP